MQYHLQDEEIDDIKQQLQEQILGSSPRLISSSIGVAQNSVAFTLHRWGSIQGFNWLDKSLHMVQ